MSRQPILSVRHLDKKIGKNPIIQDVNFELYKGEVFGFLGPNGAGKTTTIRMMVGLIQPSNGEITIGGHNIKTHFTKAIRHLGCIVENPELYAYLTGWENLEQMARMMPDLQEGAISTVVRLVGLEKRIHDKVKTYSLGMKQRLGIAQALLGQPDVLILDEPTNGLDPKGIREMRAFIRQLATEQNISVFVSSHLLSEVQLLCDRVGIISNGKMLTVASVEHLLNQQETMIWRAAPLDAAWHWLQAKTEVKRLGKDTLETPYIEEKIDDWQKGLLDQGVKILEMRRQPPTLEDLFLELTGGDAVG